MSSEFNYVRAWQELAKPAYQALQPTIQPILDQASLCDELHQEERTLDVTWPADPTFKDKFLKLDDDTLAKIGRVLYFYGHWQPGAPLLKDHFFDAHPGLSWKLANYADQILRKRCIYAEQHVLPSSGGRSITGRSFHILEGMVRVQYQEAGSNGGWIWEEAAPGTVELVTQVRALTGDVSYRTLMDIVKKVRRQLLPPDHWAWPWLAERKFMDHTKGTPYDDQEVGDFLRRHCDPAALEIGDRRAVNFRVVDGKGQPIEAGRRLDRQGKPISYNHPFAIGPKHFPKDGGMYIDPKAAPCAYCDEDADRHSHDYAVPVTPLRAMTQEEFGKILFGLKTAIEEHNQKHPGDPIKVDGFAVVEKEHKVLPAA